MIDDSDLDWPPDVDRMRRPGAAPARDRQGVAASGLRRSTEPRRYASAAACVSAYVEALGRVRSRFWATTLLGSGFWADDSGHVLRANELLLERLDGRPADVRRLFLLDRSRADTIEAYRERYLLLSQLGERSELARLDAEIDTLSHSMRALAGAGLATRIVHDRRGAHRGLPEMMAWDPSQCELAIYDRFRVDVFTGERSGALTGVTCFGRATDGFDDCLERAEGFFERLWTEASEMEEFLVGLGQAVASARDRVGYPSRWLARYDNALDADDERLKRAEAELVEETLRRSGRWGMLRRYLDIGTCTGRYVGLLRPALTAGGVVVAIDDSLESVLAARANLRRHYPDDEQVTILLRDFCDTQAQIPAAPFDLITCMMGTLSHFGKDRCQDLADSLQAALRRMADLLAVDGLLILSSWSRHACERRRLLSIYGDADLERLAAWTPPAVELERRLRAAGLVVSERAHPDRRLDTWICRR
jgi:SAM-dependent methyltransferase